MNNKQTVLLSIISSIVVVMTFVPYTGLISYGGISITTIHVPVIIGAMVLGKKSGLILGSVWGIANLVNAVISGTPEALIFIDPRISVIPRMMVGFYAGFLSEVLRGKLSTLRKYSIVIASTSTLFHTMLVLTAMALFAGNSIMPLGETLILIFSVLVSVNGVIELALAIVVVPIVINALSRAGYFKYK